MPAPTCCTISRARARPRRARAVAANPAAPAAHQPPSRRRRRRRCARRTGAQDRAPDAGPVEAREPITSARSPSRRWSAWRATRCRACAPSWPRRSSIWTACRAHVVLTLARDVETHRRGADPGIFAAAVRRRSDGDHRLRQGAARCSPPSPGASRSSAKVTDAIVSVARYSRHRGAARQSRRHDPRSARWTRSSTRPRRSAPGSMPLALRADLSARAIRRIAAFVGAEPDRAAGGAPRSRSTRPRSSSEPRAARAR